MSQVVLIHHTKEDRNWYIHNDQNGHEYKFTIKDGIVTMASSSVNAHVHTGVMATVLLDKLMTSFISAFADLANVTELKKALSEAKNILENK